MSSYESNPHIYLALRATTSTLCVMLTEEMRDTTLYCRSLLVRNDEVRVSVRPIECNSWE